MAEPLSSRSPGSPGRRSATRRSSKISTLLVDDHEIIREGLRVLLNSEDDIAVVGEASDGRQAVKLVKELRPEVVVMDIAMARLNGLEATRQILAAAPATRVLILSAHSDEEYVERAREVGAAGYVLKRSSFKDLARAIRTVKAGKTWISPSIARRQGRAGGGKSSAHGRSPGSVAGRLSPREAEVLQCIAEGMPNKETAVELGICIKTVEKHRQAIMKKLDLHNVAGLTRFAIAIGCIEGRNRSVLS